MINFIIVEDNAFMRDLYIKIIKKFFYTTKDKYCFHEFSDYNIQTINALKQICGKKIYIINTDLPSKNGFDLVRKIREFDAVDSLIIFIYPKGRKYSIKSLNGTLALSIIEQNEKMMSELYDSIESAYHMAKRYNALTYSYFDEIYRISYDDIYYIEKDTNTDVMTIYTKDDSYCYYGSIKRMAIKLSDDLRFFKSNRSCIVNTFKISNYNMKDNIITFDNGITTKNISEANKKLLREILLKEEAIVIDGPINIEVK